LRRDFPDYFSVFIVPGILAFFVPMLCLQDFAGNGSNEKYGLANPGKTR
jgi:hypothetical protein